MLCYFDFLVSCQGTRLKANMEQLKEDWAEFLKEQQRLKEEVDEEHARAVGQLSAKYNEKKKELAKFTLWSADVHVRMRVHNVPSLIQWIQSVLHACVTHAKQNYWLCSVCLMKYESVINNLLFSQALKLKHMEYVQHLKKEKKKPGICHF